MARFLIIGDCQHFVGITQNIASALQSFDNEVSVFDTIGDFCCNKSLNSSIIDTAIAYKPDIVFFIRNETIHYSTLQIIKKQCSATLAAWWLDDPLISFGKDELFVHQNNYESIRFFDYLFVFDSFHIPRLRRIGCPNVHLLPCAYNPHEYFPQEVTEEEHAYYGSDVSFIGTPYTDRGRILAQLLNYNIKLWGGKWSNPRIAEHTVKDTLITTEECRTIFFSSAINLVLPQVQSVHGYNQSLFQALGSQGFIIAPFLNDIEKYGLQKDHDIVTYETIDELKSKIDYYLTRPNERLRIARNGYTSVLRNHTYKNRAKEVCSVLGISSVQYTAN
ncbi:glycosyltransferase [bacterium]|nr:glycosyltransferase [bacterium]MCP5463136.1 glycosyltransferase [bacterium]